MSEQTRINTRRVLGIMFLLIILYINYLVFQENKTFGIFLFAGLGLGFIESHSEVGIASGYVDFFITGSRTRLYGLLLLLGLGSMVTLLIHGISAHSGAIPAFQATAAETIIPGTKAITPVNFGLVLGAFLFGVGLSLNKGCGMGTLRNIGLGQFRYILTFFAILIGTIPGQWLKYQLDQSVMHNAEVQIYFPEVVGYLGTFAVGVVVYTVLILWGIYFERVRQRKGYYREVESASSHKKNPFQKKHPIFFYILEKKWPRVVSVVLMTILLIVTLLGTGEHLAVTRAYIYPAVYLFRNMGFSLEHPAFTESVEVVQDGLFNHHIVFQNAGITLGAVLFGLLSVTLKGEIKVNVKEFGLFILSGLLMGIGAILASGCIVGALYSGIVNFSLSGWVVFLFMSFGIWLTVKVMRGKISTIPHKN